MFLIPSCLAKLTWLQGPLFPSLKSFTFSRYDFYLLNTDIMHVLATLKRESTLLSDVIFRADFGNKMPAHHVLRMLNWLGWQFQLAEDVDESEDDWTDRYFWTMKTHASYPRRIQRYRRVFP